MKKPILIFLSLIFLTHPIFAQQNIGGTGSEGKEFAMACVYGVLAGSMVGAATLAFTKKPGDHLQNIARGASLGLYAGILLGFYVTQVESEEIESDYVIHQPDWMFFPTLSEQGINGFGFQYTALSF